VHPVQLHLRDLVDIVDSSENKDVNPLDQKWCDCEELRMRLQSELNHRGVEKLTTGLPQ
jgi:hypothetical protein